MARMACSHLLPSMAIPLKSSVLNGSSHQWLRLSESTRPVVLIKRRFSVAKISMSLRAGIVGLPNVGKSTLFNAVIFSESVGARALGTQHVGRPLSVSIVTGVPIKRN